MFLVVVTDLALNSFPNTPSTLLGHALLAFLASHMGTCLLCSFSFPSPPPNFWPHFLGFDLPPPSSPALGLCSHCSQQGGQFPVHAPGCFPMGTTSAMGPPSPEHSVPSMLRHLPDHSQQACLMQFCFMSMKLSLSVNMPPSCLDC